MQTERDAAKLEELEINITMIQLKLFLAHSETIRNRACELNIPLCDCVVSFDLRECPPLVEFHRVSSSEGNITCVYISSFYNGQINDSDKIPCVIMQRLFPAERLYLMGYLSYPRTESTKYPRSFDIAGTLKDQSQDNRWGSYVSELLRNNSINVPKGWCVKSHVVLQVLRRATYKREANHLL